MNIFALDNDPVLSARAMCDKHVVKMPLESAQLLSTAHSVFGSWQVGMYQPTHINHPSAIWCRSTASNYLWLVQHGLALCHVFNQRYGHPHKSLTVIRQCSILPVGIPLGDLEPFALAMPDDCKGEDPVQSYRNYYMRHKSHLCAWKIPTHKPYWFSV